MKMIGLPVHRQSCNAHRVADHSPLGSSAPLVCRVSVIDDWIPSSVESDAIRYTQRTLHVSVK
jgi:hypothetical protein